MSMHNADIAAMLNEMADLLEIEEANPFRVRAYRNAARIIETLPQDVTKMVAQDEDLTAIRGIGKDLATKITEIVNTGKLAQLDEIRQRTPPALVKLLAVPGLGPKRVKKLFEALQVRSLADLEKAARTGRVAEVPGLGKKLQAQILLELELTREERSRVLWFVADQVARNIVEYLRQDESVETITVAGSYRRRKDTVGDLDILAISPNGWQVAEHFVRYEGVQKVVSKGETRSTVRLRSGLEVDLRVVPRESYGAALLYFTGSKAHNIELRGIAVDAGLKVNEYGVFRGDEQIAGATEEEIYRLFGLEYIPPELRENRGEIEAAREKRLPRLVELRNIRGDLHAHTKETDGNHSLEEMARAAQDLGYQYLAITDHSQALAMTRGLNEKRLAEQIDQIDALNEKLEHLVVLKGSEVDILEDGTLDLPDSILRRLDITVCSIHSRFDLSEDRQTERIIRAMDNPHFKILAHPSGRLMQRRPPYEIDLERLMRAAIERGCYMEVSGQPDRLDLNDVHCKMAKDLGLKLAISTDAHRTAELLNMRLGIGQARRGWIEAKEVLNTRTLRQLRKLLKR